MNKRPLPCVLAGFVLGEVWIYQFKETAAIAAFCLATALIFLSCSRRRGSFFAPFCLFCMVGIFLGGIRQWRWMEQKERFSQLYDKEVCSMEGQITEKKTREHGILLVIDEITVEGVSYSGKLQVYLEEEPVFVIGSVIKMKGKVEAFSLPTNPGEFNQRTYQEGRGIFGCCYQPEVEKIYYGSFLIWDGVMEFREKTGRFLQENMGREQHGVAMAMLLGDKSALLEEQKSLFQWAGISHILAVSGLHMTLIGAGIYKIFRKIGLPYGISVGASFPCIFLYAVMTGMGSSCLRAAIMLTVYLVAEWKGLSYDLPSALALSGLLLLWEIPARLFDSGFLLSYGALLGVGVGYPFLKEQMGWNGKNILEQLLSGLFLLFFTLPLSLFFFYGVSLAGIFLNLLVIPLMSFLVPFLSFGSIGWISWYPTILGDGFLFFGGKIIDLYLFLCQWSRKIPGSYLQLGYRGVGFAFLYYGSLGAVLFLIFYGNRKALEGSRQKGRKKKEEQERLLGIRQTRNGGVLVAWMLFSIVLVWISGKRGAYLTVLDVGQGDGILYHSTDGVVCMVDGGSSSKKQVGSYVIQSALEYYGIARVDYWFVSHTDEDHISGLEELLEKGYPVEHLIVPERREKSENQSRIEGLAKKNGTKLHYMSRGQKITLTDSVFHCLHPKKKASGEDINQDSLVLLLETEWQQILLTGDVEKSGEEEMTRELKSYQEKRRQSTKVKILKTAHHGSKNATQENFLYVYEPDIALISAGKNNRYGHPAEETVKRMREAGVRFYNTATVGAIEVQLGGDTRYYHYGE